LFRAWLDEHYPDRATKVMSIIQDMRGGRDYQADWFTRMRGQGVWADLLAARFRKAIKRYGLEGERPALRTDLFRPPEGPQMRLF
jgi:DNA repair photolyase